MEKAVRKLNRAETGVESAKELVASTTEARRVASDQAEAGTANRSVFLESEASMLNAQADLLRAEYDRSVAAADLARLTGTTMNEHATISDRSCSDGMCGGGRQTRRRTRSSSISGALERLAATVAPAVVQVQVSAWCASASANGEDAASVGILPGRRLGRHRRSLGIHHHQ